MFGTGATNAGHVIGSDDFFPSGISQIWARFNVYNVSPEMPVNIQWLLNSSPISVPDATLTVPNGWFLRSLCITNLSGRCDPTKTLPSGTYELHIGLSGNEVLVGSVLVGSPGSSAPSTTELAQPRLSRNLLRRIESFSASSDRQVVVDIRALLC